MGQTPRGYPRAPARATFDMTVLAVDLARCFAGATPRGVLALLLGPFGHPFLARLVVSLTDRSLGLSPRAAIGRRMPRFVWARHARPPETLSGVAGRLEERVEEPSARAFSLIGALYNVGSNGRTGGSEGTN